METEQKPVSLIEDIKNNDRHRQSATHTGESHNISPVSVIVCPCMSVFFVPF